MMGRTEEREVEGKNRTLRLHAPRDLRFHNEPIPSPAPGEVLLEVLSVGVCRSDLDYWNDGRIGDQVIEEPLVPGHEFSARVVEVGEGVDRALEGRRVAVEPAIPCMKCEWCLRGDTNICPNVRFCGTPPVDGALRRYMAYPAGYVVALPESVSDDAGAVLEPLAIGVHAIDLAKPRLAQSAAVVGCGPVGLSILEAGRAAGMGRIFALDRLRWRLDLARDLGADETIDVDRADPVAALRDLTGGRGVDLVFEAAGTDDAPGLATELAAPGGKVFLAGIPPCDETRFRASTSRRRGLTIYAVRRSRHTLERTLDMLTRGELDGDRLVSHRFPFSRAPEVFSLVHNYEDNVVKAIIRVGED